MELLCADSKVAHIDVPAAQAHMGPVLLYYWRELPALKVMLAGIALFASERRRPDDAIGSSRNGCS